MIITKLKKNYSRVRHIFTRNDTNGLYYSDRDSDFCLRLEEFLTEDGVTIYGIKRDDGTEFIVGQTLIEELGELLDEIIIDADEVNLFSSDGDSVNLTQATVSSQNVPSTAANNMSFMNIQTTIEESFTRKIRLERTAKRREETPEQFLVKFFKEWNIDGKDKDDNDDAKDTIYSDTHDVQTETGKRRSLGDIYMIMKYYYPSITLKEVAKLLYVKLPTVITDGFRTSKCSQIRKRVWYYDPDDTNLVYDKTSNDEYSHTWQWWITNLNN